MTCNEMKKYIFENNKIEFVLEKLGCHSIEFHPNENQYMAAFPDGDNKAGIVIKNNVKLNFYSYSRGINVDEERDIVYLVQKIKNVTFPKAVRFLHDLFGLKYVFNTNKKNEPEKENKYNPLEIFEKNAGKSKYRNVLDFSYEALNEDVLDDFVPMIHIDIFREGIAPWTIKKFGLGYSYKFKRTIFPIRHCFTGELLGYNGRTSVENYDLFGIRKYYISPGYNKSMNLYGLWENYQDIEKADYIVIGESEKSVCKRDSLGDSTWVALQGKSISNEQVEIVLKLDIHEVVIALDKDAPIEEVWHICSKFFCHRKVSFIWDKYNLLGDKDSPADAKNKIYEFLFKYRITYNEQMHEKYEKSLKRKR